MKKVIACVVVGFLVWSWCSPSADGCPFCTRAATGSANPEDQAGISREAQAYNQSIYLMMAMPYLLVGTVSYLIYRGYRKQAQQMSLADPASADLPCGEDSIQGAGHAPSPDASTLRDQHPDG
jgi:hypothetical protein